MIEWIEEISFDICDIKIGSVMELLSHNDKGVIYFLCQSNEIVYIGESEAVLSRIFAHYKDGYKNFDKVFVTQSFDILETKAGRVEIEKILIRKFKPLYNDIRIKMTDINKSETRKMNKFLRKKVTPDVKMKCTPKQQDMIDRRERAKEKKHKKAEENMRGCKEDVIIRNLDNVHKYGRDLQVEILQQKNLSSYKRVKLAYSLKDKLSRITNVNLSKAGKGEKVDPINTRKEIALIAGVGTGTIGRYEQILKYGTKKLLKQLDENEISIGNAYKEIMKL